MKKVLSVVGNTLLVIIILLAVTLTFMSLNTNEKGLTTINGYIFLNIQTDSMEPTINQGDFILTKEVPFDEIKTNDIVAFLVKEQNETIIKTHRVIGVEEESAGIKKFITQGDNTPAPDASRVYESSYVAKYANFRIPFLGAIFTFLSSSVGFFIFIIIPLFILFVYQIYKFISAIMEEKKKEMIEKAKEELIKEKQKDEIEIIE